MWLGDRNKGEDMFVTNKMIREHVMRRDGVEKVLIKRNGEVHCYGSMPRGDGGRKYWWMFVSDVLELTVDIQSCR